MVNRSLLMVIFLLFVGNITILHSQIRTVPHPKRSHLNNICWSIDSKMLAYESFDVESDEPPRIYIYSLDDTRTKPLTKVEDDPFFSSRVGGTSNNSKRLPAWSQIDTVLYLLYRDPGSIFKSERLLGKTRAISFENLPQLSGEIIYSVYKDIKQYATGLESDISEYHLWYDQRDSIEIFFAKLTSKPHLIFYASPWGLEPLPNMETRMSQIDIIDSFCLSSDGEWLSYVSGVDNKKRIVIGELNWDASYGGTIISAHYCTLRLTKTDPGILQEPLFSPTSPTTLAYIEFIPVDELTLSNELHIIKNWPSFAQPIKGENRDGCKDIRQATGTGSNIIVKKDIYRNEKNKIPRPNATSYSWHPDGKRVFYINSSREIEYVDVSGSELQYEVLYGEQIQHAEQLAISPDGQFMAVLIHKQIAESEALTAIQIISLPL